MTEIREAATRVGFDDVGIARAEIPDEDIAVYRDWIAQGWHGDMAYLENEMRCFPETWLPGARSAILFASYYRQRSEPFRSDAGLIASYARGRDYHNVHRRRLRKFIRWLEARVGQERIARGFSDSAPVLERALAVQAGLGWMGKNALVIHRRFGTFFLLAGVFSTLELPHRLYARTSRCGRCTRCIDACPTDALHRPFWVEATKCLSYQTIENPGPIPEALARQNPGYLFGCDICQDVCPHNRDLPVSERVDFSPARGPGAYLDWEAIDAITREPERLHGSALQRRGAVRLAYTAGLLREATGRGGAGDPDVDPDRRAEDE